MPFICAIGSIAVPISTAIWITNSMGELIVLNGGPKGRNIEPLGHR